VCLAFIKKRILNPGGVAMEAIDRVDIQPVDAMLAEPEEASQFAYREIHFF
jgi:hypothetical protein